MENNATTSNQTEMKNVKSAETIKAERLAAKKAAREANKAADKTKAENLTFPLMNSKRENIGFIHPDEIKNPLQFIGNLIKTTTSKVLFFVDFPKNHVVSVVPASGTYGEKERALIAHRNYLTAITESLERQDAITDTKTLQTLNLYKAKGWKFMTYTKLGVLEVCKAKLAEVTTQVNLVKEITFKCPELSKVIEANELRKEIAKEIKDKGIEAGIKLAKEKSFKALPTINK